MQDANAIRAVSRVQGLQTRPSLSIHSTITIGLLLHGFDHLQH